VRSATERTSPLTFWAQSVPSSAAQSQGDEQSPVSGARTGVKEHEVGLARAPRRAAADGVSVLVRDVVPAAITPSANAPQPGSVPGAGAGGGAASQVPIAMDRPDWDTSLGERVVWLVGKDLRQAELHLDPPELGRIKVHITLAGDQANVSFTARHEVVRDALESALPRLRDMLSDQGWNAVNVSVSQQSAHHGRHHSGGAAPDYPVTPVDGDADEEAWSRPVAAPAASFTPGAVDDYA
jgi:flagellar hook-length control protein FliK